MGFVFKELFPFFKNVFSDKESCEWVVQIKNHVSGLGFHLSDPRVLGIRILVRIRFLVEGLWFTNGRGGFRCLEVGFMV